MDIFEKVQQTRPAIEGEEENLVAARALLLMEIQRQREPASSRAARRPWFIAAGALGAAAAVTAGVLVVSSITAPAPTVEAVPTRVPGAVLVPSPVPSPAPTLRTGPEALVEAANAAAAFVPPVVAPGQYLRRGWETETLYVYDSSFDSPAEPGLGGLRSTATSAWVVERSGANYAPADLTSAWYSEWSAGEVRRVLGDSAEAGTQMEELVRSFGSGQVLTHAEAPQLPEGGGENLLWFLDVMPHDPEAMIAWIRDRLGPDVAGWEEGKIGWMLIGLLSFNVGDPEVRASMYRALSLLPGSTVGEEHDGKRTVTFDSHLGTPEGPQTSLQRFTLTVEMSSGIVTEVTSTSELGAGMIPGDIPDSRMTMEMSVVDSLP